MNLRSRIQKLEQEFSPAKPWKKVTLNEPTTDAQSLMHEQLKQGEQIGDFNWIVRRVVDPN